MIRLDGNAILIADPDSAYGESLSAYLSQFGARCFRAEHISGAKLLLKKYDFDLVISNYYLADGIIHQLIDWSTNNLESLPIFTCIGYPYPADSFSHRHAIAEIFSKNDSSRIMASLSRLLFDFNEFQESLFEMAAPTEILIELHTAGKTDIVRPIEINEESLFLQFDSSSPKGAFGVLKFSFLSGSQGENFLIPGYFEGDYVSGQTFRINQKYLPNWTKFLKFLNVKQLNVTNFLKKASGF
ncbi:MAG: hypothetical protein ACLGHN_04555 [Bacteriovoracia bacterium]